ncbi:hypothetical protein RHGRI_000160 [Rhododendron griersonianum]|uniref:PGG domain-containing protein n=1 Tax=Rhododendron griersonianum TaxID=479676 RepID=A0AAV6LGJ9_9ERIC|nr:hypothetical protein RHGRI_000160 [Rhododendron griersonianum]
MEELLCDAAMRGDLESLHEIIARDNYILDKVLVGCFKGKNPLHLAISTGQVEFVQKLLEIKPKLAEVVDTELGAALHIASANGNLEIVEILVKEIKPKLAKVLDTELGAALHIASANGDIKIVEALVELSPEMCMARNQDGNNPLHIAAMEGKVHVLKKLVETFPLAAQVILDQGDTILHLCVKYNQLECLRLLLEIIRDPEFVQSKDANGNSMLHVAVFSKRFEVCPYSNYFIVKFLLIVRSGIYIFQIVEHVLNSTRIDMDAPNGAGWTAMDIYFFVRNRSYRHEVDVRIEKFLRTAGARRRREMLVFTSQSQEKLMQTVMVVSSLFATMAFHVGVNPPGGVWQDNFKGHDNFKERIAGKAIIAYKYPKSYSCFMYFNTVGFLLSSSLILFLLMASVQLRPKRRRGWVILGLPVFTIMTTAFAYTYSVIVVSPKHMVAITDTILVSVIVWAFVMLLFAVAAIAGKAIIAYKYPKSYSYMLHVFQHGRIPSVFIFNLVSPIGFCATAPKMS